MRSMLKPTKRRRLFIGCVLCSTAFYLTVFRPQISVKQFKHFVATMTNLVQEPVTKKMRQNLTFFANLSTGVIRPDADAAEAETMFHRYASELQVACPESIRLGNRDDGGWDMCIYSSYRPRPKCLVYSFGIKDDWSFDDDVAETYTCTVRSFDPSINASDQSRRGANIWFYRQGIGGTDEVNGDGWQIRTLESFMKMFDENEDFLDYLKIDVEMNEWSAIEALLGTAEVLGRVKQIGLETHTKEMTMTTRSTVPDLVYYSGLLRRLREAGFYRWYARANRWGKFDSEHSRRELTCCYETVLINVNIPFARN